MNLKYGPYSPTRLDVAACPYAFYKQYIDQDKKPQPESLPQARGAAVHEVFEKITNHMKVGDILNLGVNIKSWMQEAIINHPAAYEDAKEIHNMVNKYLTHPPKGLTSDAEVEKKMGVKLSDIGFVECAYDDPGAIARGRADIFMITDDTTEAVIFDHKTQPNIEDANTFQMGFYAWVVWKVHPFLQKITTVLHFARYGAYRSYEWTKEALQEVENDIMLRIGVIENTEQWTACPNTRCQYCPFLTECPTFGEMVEVNQDGTMTQKHLVTLLQGGASQAVKVAGYLVVIDQIRERLLKELKAYVSISGPVAIPGLVYEFRGKDEVDWDKANAAKRRKQVYEVFEKYGIDPREYMGFSATFTKDVFLLGKEDLLQELAALFPRKTKTEFRGFKL